MISRPFCSRPPMLAPSVVVFHSCYETCYLALATVVVHFPLAVHMQKFKTSLFSSHLVSRSWSPAGGMDQVHPHEDKT